MHHHNLPKYPTVTIILLLYPRPPPLPEAPTSPNFVPEDRIQFITNIKEHSRVVVYEISYLLVYPSNTKEPGRVRISIL
jgi:hypothetical protein